jgi:hypothetical protein
LFVIRYLLWEHHHLAEIRDMDMEVRACHLLQGLPSEGQDSLMPTTMSCRFSLMPT